MSQPEIISPGDYSREELLALRPSIPQIMESLREIATIWVFPTYEEQLAVFQDYISKPVYIPPTFQYRFPRSKKKRMQKKWRDNKKNWRAQVYTLSKNPEALLRRMKRESKNRPVKKTPITIEGNR